jgi:hypothetical protein
MPGKRPLAFAQLRTCSRAFYWLGYAHQKAIACSLVSSQLGTGS